MALVFSGRYIVANIACLKWHVANNEVINKDNFILTLPNNWWVVNGQGDNLQLSRTPDIFENNSLFVFILKKQLLVTDEGFFRTSKRFKGILLKRLGEINELTVAGELAYRVTYQDEFTKELYWTWTIPSKNTVITSTSRNHVFSEVISLELIGNLKWK
jgi:hypothetical protein